jgi:hypothetical protein
MLPKWHFLLGIIFCILLYLLFPSIGYINLLIVFFSSFFIDVDHYFYYALRKKDWNLKRAIDWHYKLPKYHKPMFHIFHSIEFIIFLFILSFHSTILFFILLGIVFHSLIDIFDMMFRKRMGQREFLAFRFLLSNKNNYL